jgi:hypothetical protein
VQTHAETGSALAVTQRSLSATIIVKGPRPFLAPIAHIEYLFCQRQRPLTRHTCPLGHSIMQGHLLTRIPIVYCTFLHLSSLTVTEHDDCRLPTTANTVANPPSTNSFTHVWVL